VNTIKMLMSVAQTLFFTDPPKILIFGSSRSDGTYSLQCSNMKSVTIGGSKHLRRFNTEFYPGLLATVVLIAAATCAPNEAELRSGEGQTAAAISTGPHGTSGPTEKELEAARKAVEAGPLPGPPVPQAETPKRPPESSETQPSPPPRPHSSASP
jgi:hypothetical protein